MTMFQSVNEPQDLESLVELYRRGVSAEALLYLETRGVSEKTAAAFSLGFEDLKIGFTAQPGRFSGMLGGRIVFPIRDQDGRVLDLIGRSLEEREPKYKSLLGTAQLLFNAPVLQEAEDVVLAGGMFDVLSLAQAGIPAVAVPDCLSFHREQAEWFAGKRVFVCYGNDDEGRRENERVANLLEDAADAAYIVTLPEGIKDINDLYVRAENAQDVFESLIERAVHTQQASGIAPDSHFLTQYNEEYLKRRRGLVSGIPTGILELDDLLFGGFRPGLYVISGPVGSGKTTLLRQMADHAAALGCPVVFVSWGASAFELWANSLSRLLDCSVRDILLGNIPPEEIKRANEQYQEFAERMWTIEGTMDTSLEEVADVLQRIAQTCGKSPVVFLDYLQRIPISSEEPMLPSPEQSGLVAYGLHQIARELNCPVVAAAVEEREGASVLAQAVEAAADVWMSLTECRGEAAEGLPMRLDVRKNRDGDSGSVLLRFDERPAVLHSEGGSHRKSGDEGADLTTA